MVKYFNPNPNRKFFKSGNPKNWYLNDSSVRAVACALNKEWVDAYDMLAEAGRKIFDIPTSRPVLDEVLINNGFEFVTLGKPRKGESRPVVSEFIKDFSDKTIVLNLADYFVTVINGEIYDVSDRCTKSSVYYYWVKK